MPQRPCILTREIYEANTASSAHLERSKSYINLAAASEIHKDDSEEGQVVELRKSETLASFQKNAIDVRLRRTQSLPIFTAEYIQSHWEFSPERVLRRHLDGGDSGRWSDASTEDFFEDDDIPGIEWSIRMAPVLAAQEKRLSTGHVLDCDQSRHSTSWCQVWPEFYQNAPEWPESNLCKDQNPTKTSPGRKTEHPAAWRRVWPEFYQNVKHQHQSFRQRVWPVYFSSTQHQGQSVWPVFLRGCSHLPSPRTDLENDPQLPDTTDV
ncbi:MAG: hypothetical protein KVP17_003500 [Porospora cf. gigantea B]|uniref:uncharacterized protein n=1 Tax=Porospora cf. gigantea B TaxID=2853592 RepID=UPI003571E8CE|nr:MAG: hypothetical protein KVP17_003500 [Porospora cf. gigantea B]